MAVRRLLAVGLWLCVTATATAVVWAGTSTVAADLTDRPAPVVAHREVVEALQPGSSSADTTPGISPPLVSAVAPDAAAEGSGSSSASPSEPSAPRASEPEPDVVPAPQPPSPPTTPPPAPPTTQPPPGPSATYSTAGGVVRVSCRGFLIDLISATPNNGYSVNVANAGPFYVEVHFLGPGRDVPLWAFCLGEPVRAYNGPPIPR